MVLDQIELGRPTVRAKTRPARRCAGEDERRCEGGMSLSSAGSWQLQLAVAVGVGRWELEFWQSFRLKPEATIS